MVSVRGRTEGLAGGDGEGRTGLGILPEGRERESLPIPGRTPAVDGFYAHRR